MKEYYLMSEDAIKSFLPQEDSKPILWLGKPVYIAVLDFSEFEAFYNSLDDDYKTNCSIWVKEITNSAVKDFDIMDLVTNNLFTYILEKYGCSTMRNVCAIIGGISEKFTMSPIELFDYINDNFQSEI